jgi:hypothetical protein
MPFVLSLIIVRGRVEGRGFESLEPPPGEVTPVPFNPRIQKAFASQSAVEDLPTFITLLEVSSEGMNFIQSFRELRMFGKSL